ncbi:MAG: proton-conducting transporter transmembrane domain-containing protein [Acidimicrobiales bacterium]
MLLTLILLLPFSTGALALFLPWSRWTGRVMSFSALVVLAMGIALSVRTSSHAALTSLHGALRADALSSFMVVVIGAVSLLAALQTTRSMSHEIESGTTIQHARYYAVLFQVFVTCMLAAVLAANLGVLWIAVEATTISTTFLVNHRRSEKSFEAAWKYVILCSVGIALAFLGTVLVYFAALHAGGHTNSVATLDWTSLMKIAPRLDPGVLRLALALLVLGYGTKVGLAPMHSWLPDAHSQAPAPISALMSGVLLTVAFYALLRFKAIADVALGVSFPRYLFIVVGLASLLVASAMVIAQRDYKRMLAYSSVEHMGLLALGAAAGSPLAIAAVLLHILGHGMTKSVLFLASGEIHHSEDTTSIAKVSGLIARKPLLGGTFGIAILALLGFPPFSLFVSELNMARAELDAGLWWVVLISLGCLGVIFASMATHARSMLLGSSDARASDDVPRSVIVPLTGALLTCAIIGVSSWPLLSLLHNAAKVLVR